MHKWRPAHFFGQNPSINPAVVSKRISGYTALGGGNDTYTREQTFEAADVQGSLPGEADAEIKVNKIKFFRGGKGGSGATEISFVHQSGQRIDTIKETDGTTTKSTTSASIKQFAYNVGWKAFGAGIEVAQFTFEASDSIGIDGDTYESDFNATMTFLMGKLGFATNIGSLYFGVMGTLVIMNIDQESQNNNPGQVQPDDDGGAGGGLMVGAGAGIRTNNLHLEIGVEKPQVSLYRPK